MSGSSTPGPPISERADSMSSRPRSSPHPDAPSSPLLPSQRNHSWLEHRPKKSRQVGILHEPKPREYAPYNPDQPAPAYPGMPQSQPPTQPPTPTPANSQFGHRHRASSWDLLGGVRRFEHSFVEFDPRRASQDHLAFAEGDVPKNTFSRLYNYLIDVSIVTRWTIYILPVLGLVWIPGILGLTTFKDTTIWGTKLIWWSIWLTVVWCGWWVALACSMVLPHIARATLGVVAVGARKYIDWLLALERYIALTAWTLVIWISFQPLVNTRRQPGTSASSAQAEDTMSRLLFVFFVCAAILFGEKFAIQWIAANFHERSYADRIAEQKFTIRMLVKLYRHSSDIPWRSDTLHDGNINKGAEKKPRKLFKKALQGMRFAATTTTTILGNVATEIAGSSVLQPNSPQAVIKTALESSNKSRLLARRLFYSFVKPGADYLTVNDLAPFFSSQEEAEAAFAIFDKDMNGDATRDELEMACMEIHHEQQSITHSMHDLDSAVGRLDSILLSVYLCVVVLILAVALDAQLSTLITGAGTFILGLSWLIGISCQEVLLSIIFLFVKHPYDVGDRIRINDLDYTVKEMRLLTTVMLDGNSCYVQAPHTLLNTMFIQNIRRSPQMSETFEFDVAYGTTFEDMERLRELMIAFLKSERRDYFPMFDISVADMPAQEKMTLRADIKYKSNWQQGALMATRRNKWISALKQAMQKAKVFGPKGDPDAIPDPDRYTEVPWKMIEEADKKKLAKLKQQERQEQPATQMQEMRAPVGKWTLTDNEAIIRDESQDVFGADDSDEAYTRAQVPQNPSNTMQDRPAEVTMPTAMTMPTPQRETGEAIEMKPSPSRSTSA
ncbi:hypothetical protein AcV7_004488 [Taiwanofungus camphoratus]|nr:hypothetical protein AcV7_004488 [Antrodia cinnamomea]